jgi:hypothetical protein
MFWKSTPLAAALSLALSSGSAPLQIIPPAVPANLVVPAGNAPFAIADASGTQNYICLPTEPSGKKPAWTFLGPQATLFTTDGQQVMTHYLSPNPDQNDTPRATWRDSHDTSTVWAGAVASSTDPAYVEAGAIPWLLLRVVGSEYGPTLGDRLVGTTFIQRVNTSGGVAPPSGCQTPRDIGARAMVPYTTQYVFYR